MKLYIEGHSPRLGYGIAVQYTAAEINSMPPVYEAEPPVRFIASRSRAFLLVERFNRRFATLGT